jgi:undecaprenyl-diphosphatase
MLKKFAYKLHNLDRSLCLRISGWNGRKTLDRIMYAFSHIGYGYLYPVVFLFTAIFDRVNSRPLLQSGGLAFLIGMSSQTILKKKAKRRRPIISLPQVKSLMKAPDQFSFPSGHAAGAFMMATLFNYFYPSLAVPLYGTASVIGFSRVYNGVHYPSDVLAGTCLGIFSARIGLIFMA